jgi:Glycosyl hydrolase family 79 C-terminal beta domain
MGSDCSDTTVPATLAKNLMDHSHMTSIMWYHDFLSNYSVAHGVPYVIGETNSISCQGQAGISDVFGAALWSIDYVLYVATLHVSRIYFHMGTPYRYSAWQPITDNGTAAHPKALYYGNLFTSTALAGGNKQVTLLVNETHLTSYGIYDACEEGAKLTGVAVINLNMWNSTQPAGQRPYTEVNLPSEFQGRDLSIRRLTAPGVELTGNITFAGRSVALNGDIVGDEVLERVVDGKVLVGESEALLITI